MQTKPLERAEAGLHIHSPKNALVAEIISENPDGFSFLVLNGSWRGRTRNGRIFVDEVVRGKKLSMILKDEVGIDDFVQILSVTSEEFLRYHLDESHFAVDILDIGSPEEEGPAL